MEQNKVKVNNNIHEQLGNNRKWTKGQNPAYIEYRRKWVENPQKYIIENAPIHLDIETSSICNLRCPMCMVTVELEKGSESRLKKGLMDWDLYTKIVDEAAEIGVSSIKLNWRGEPTMHPRLADMVRYAKEKNILDVMFNTNAVRLDEKLSKELIEAGLDEIFFSVDSIDPEKYEKIRIGAKYEDVIANIKRFSAINEEAGHPVYTRAQKVLMNDTDQENEEYVIFFSKYVDQVAFLDCIPFGERGYGKEVKREGKFPFTCAQLWQRLLITWDGKCHICCTDIVDDGLVVGNIAESSIRDVWNSEKLQGIRKLHEQGLWYEVGSCKNCYTPHM